MACCPFAFFSILPKEIHRSFFMILIHNPQILELVVTGIDLLPSDTLPLARTTDKLLAGLC